MRMTEDERVPMPTVSRYRALLDVSRAMVEQPTVKAVLHSFRAVLSSGCRLHGAHLYVLGSDRESLHLVEFDQEADAPAINIGTTISCIGEVARALEGLEPVFLPDVSQEMLKHSELAPFAAESVGRSTYVFPVCTSQQRYGILSVTKDRGQQFAPEDVELLRSLASHVAVALECAVARDNAEFYQRQVLKERDRLRLLLEINNHVVSKLDIHNLFLAASASIRNYFRNDFTGFWLVDKKSNQLERIVLDFPSGRGLLLALERSELSDVNRENLRARVPELLSVEDMERLPARIVEKIKAESITSVAIAPMVTAGGPVGVMAMGSRQPNSFRQEDLDLLSQISTQIALAVENAIAFGRVTEPTRSLASAAPSFEQAERQVIIDALRAASGKVSGQGGAAERLGLKRTTLQNKMRKLNINRAEHSG